MASNTKYAKNLIGNWKTDQFKAQRDAIQSDYDTNWSALTSQLNALNDQLDRNFQNARTSYNELLGDVAQESFNRMYNAETNLTNRGLAGSGLINTLAEADTQQKGIDLDQALSQLVKTSAEGIDKSIKATTGYGEDINDLAGNLASSLGKVSSSEASNYQQYVKGVSSIAESKAKRDAAAAKRAATKAKASKENEMTEKEKDERRTLIEKTLSSNKFSDTEKVAYLINYLDIKPENAKAAVSAYNYDKEKVEYDKVLANYNEAKNKVTAKEDKAKQTKTKLDDFITGEYNILSIPRSVMNSRKFALDKAQKELDKYTQGDLEKLVYSDDAIDDKSSDFITYVDDNGDFYRRDKVNRIWYDIDGNQINDATIKAIKTDNKFTKITPTKFDVYSTPNGTYYYMDDEQENVYDKNGNLINNTISDDELNTLKNKLTKVEGLSTQEADNNSKLNNYKLRLAEAGVDVDDTEDTRNWFEKLTNLPENQNWFFDLADLIGRPQQALYGGINNAQTGKGSVWEGIKSGFSGNTNLDYKQLLKDATGSELGDTPGKIDLVDILTLPADVALDPLDWEILPKISKVGNVVNKADDVADATKVLNKLDDVADATKVANNLDDGIDIAKELEKAFAEEGDDFAEILGRELGVNQNTLYKDLEKALTENGDDFAEVLGRELGSNADNVVRNGSDILEDLSTKINKADDIVDIAKPVKNGYKVTMTSVSDELGNLARKGIGATVKVTDNVFEKALQKLDNARGITYSNANSKWASELGKVGKGNGLLDGYKSFKNNISSWFSTKLSRNARKLNKQLKAKEDLIQRYFLENYGIVLNEFDNAANILGKNADEVARDINKIVDVNKQLNVEYIIRNAQEGTIKYTDEINNILKNIAADDPDNFDKLVKGIKKGKNDILDLSDDWGKALNNGNFDGEKLNQMVNRGSFYSEKELKEIDDLTKLYQEKAPNAIKSFQDFYENGNKALSQEFSTLSGLDNKFDNLSQGFSKHAVNSDFNDKVKALENFGVSPEDIEKQLLREGGTGPLGTSTLNTRKYAMSAGEANILKKQELKALPGLSEAGKKFIDEEVELFDDLATSGMQEYMKQMPKLGKNTKVIDEILVKQGVGDIQEIERLSSEIKKGINVAENSNKLNTLLDNTPFRRLTSNGKAPYGFKKLDKETKETVVNFLENAGKKTGSEDLIKSAKAFSKIDNIAIDPTVLNIIKFNADTTQQSKILKMYDKMLGYFKGNKTMSFTNQMNNIIGNSQNMLMSGMGIDDYAKYTTRAFVETRQLDNIMNKAADSLYKYGDLSGLSKKETEIYNRLLGFEQNVSMLDDASLLKKYGIDDAMEMMKNKEINLPLNKLREGFMKLNAAEDRMYKYATYLKALDDPKYLDNLGIDIVDDFGRKLSLEERAGRAVNKVLFDAEDLTDFEQNVVKRVVPFYTFTKKNLAFQIDNMGRNFSNYNRLMKVYNGLSDATIGEENYDNLPEYYRDNMYIPLIKNENGDYKFIRAQLPIGDLIDMTSDPLNGLVNKLSPLVKMPFELATNTNTFNGAPISGTNGKGSINMFNNIPVLNNPYVQHILSGTLGVDVPVKQIDRTVTGIKEGGVGNGLSNLLTLGGNVDKDKLNRQYEQVDSLKSALDKYKNKGYEIKTIDELREANKNGTVEGLNAMFNKYGVLTTEQQNGDYSELYKILYGLK